MDMYTVQGPKNTEYQLVMIFIFSCIFVQIQKTWSFGFDPNPNLKHPKTTCLAVKHLTKNSCLFCHKSCTYAKTRSTNFCLGPHTWQSCTNSGWETSLAVRLQTLLNRKFTSNA